MRIYRVNSDNLQVAITGDNIELEFEYDVDALTDIEEVDGYLLHIFGLNGRTYIRKIVVPLDVVFSTYPEVSIVDEATQEEDLLNEFVALYTDV